MNRVRLLQFGLLLIVAPVLMYSLAVLWRTGEFRNLEAIIPDQCLKIEGVLSSEDITIDKLTRMAFVSGADRRTGQSGKIYGYDLNRPGSSPRPLTNAVSFEFRPHGISLLRTPTGQVFLFVVNHRSDASTVERFLWDGQELIHERTFQDPIIWRPNDIAAVGPDQFYVSVEGRATSPTGKFLESWLQTSRGYVAFFDRTSAYVAASGFAFTNGIQLSSDKTQLFVAATVGQTMTVLNRSDDNRLSMDQVLDMGTGVDNLEVDLDNTIWIAAHPKLLSFLWYMGGEERRSPSEVFRIRVFEQTLYERVPFFIDPNGDLLSASSVAAFDSGTLLVGSAADRHFLDCRLSER